MTREPPCVCIILDLTELIFKTQYNKMALNGLLNNKNTLLFLFAFYLTFKCVQSLPGPMHIISRGSIFFKEHIYQLHTSTQQPITWPQIPSELL